MIHVETEYVVKPVPVTKVKVRCVKRTTKQLYYRDVYLYSDYDTREEELEAARKIINSDTDIALAITESEAGKVMVRMPVEQFLSESKLITKKETEK